MKVKCKGCGNPVERKDAYKIIKNGTNHYYCNEEEYKEILNKKEIRDNMNLEIENIFGYKVTNTALYKEISLINNSFTNEQILAYLKANHQYLSDILNKDYKSEYAKIRYFSAILKNSLADFVRIEKKQSEIKKEVIMDMSVKSNFKPRARKKSLNDIENEVID